VFQKILLAYDGSRGAEKALHVAIDLAARYEAELHCIAVAESLAQHKGRIVGGSLRTEQEAEDYFRLLTIHAGQAAASAGVRLDTHTLTGHEAETIATFATVYRFDLLIVGFTGHSNVAGHAWGSTSQSLARLAPCSVLVVK
jgi:nucleotide-binding universal stress UspA family protein